MPLCNGSAPLDFSESCVRLTWAALFPAVVAALLCLTFVPLPAFAKEYAYSASNPFARFITLPEAEALAAGTSYAPQAQADITSSDAAGATALSGVALWRTLVLSLLATLEALAWLAIEASILVIPTSRDGVYTSVLIGLLASSWVYAAVVPAARPHATVHYDLFTLYLVHFACGVILLGGTIYEHKIRHVPLPLPYGLAAMIANLLIVMALLVTVMTMPMGIPSAAVRPEDIGTKLSAEDYTTLLGWVSYSWVFPLIRKGSTTTLYEDDVWDLSPTVQSRPVFSRFDDLSQKSLLRHLWQANSLDIIMDTIGAVTKITLKYTSPFFLKRILDSVAEPTPENHARAFVYALLAFTSTLLRGQVEAQQRWVGQRAAARIRVELMAAVYNKALKRVDYSGIVDKSKLERRSADGNTKKAEKEGDEPTAGADVGKIVNLMAVDTNRVAVMMSMLYILYGAPIEIVVASIFLYNILGWSAFTGFAVLVVAWPLSSFVAKRRVRIQKGVSASRDRRMGILNELLGAVKFIKFFAWEERWIDKTMRARAEEIGWIVKARINSVFFSMIWTCAPIFVSFVSFMVYVSLGNELTVPVAFTAIALFSMIRLPMNSLPSFLIQFLQTLVAIRRLETFLNEEEVSAQVSSLKQTEESLAAENAIEGLGIENGSFTWNAVPNKPEEDSTDKNAKNGKKTKHGKDVSRGTVSTMYSQPSTSNVGSTTLADSESARSASTSGFEDHRFELQDISVRFPEGRLSVITGPTASGKTALLMALLGEMTLTQGKLLMAKNTRRVDGHGYMHSFSYAAQMPWLRHQSIRDNILFGYPYDEERYNDVVECCALKPDLGILEDGDATEIGARGVSLSGGQKARVALARAVYARSKYVILDDPLSAVDSHTARFLYERLLCGPLLANRTVILVTHHVELVLPGTHYLVRMLDGRIDTQGTTQELRAQGILEEIAQDSAAELKEEGPVVASEAPADAPAVAAAEDEQNPDEANRKPRKLIKEEHREEGGVKWAIYKAYIKASSYWTWIILSTLIVIMQVISVAERLWIREWGAAYGTNVSQPTSYGHASMALVDNEAAYGGVVFYAHQLSQNSPYQVHAQVSPVEAQALPDAHIHPLFYVGIYGLIGLSSAFVLIIAVLVQYTGALRASRLLFRRLLVGVVRATMRWHDVTPTGRMLNRFGKDIETIDDSLANSLTSVTQSLATFAAAVITIAVFFPIFLLPAVVLGYVYYVLALGYLSTTRDLRRMESNSRSPIFSGFGELLEGIVTVRAFSAEGWFMDGLHAKIDVTIKMWYMFWMSNRWLMLNLDYLGALAVLITTLFTLSGWVDAGIAGICITSAITFTDSVYWACRFWSGLELELNSVERLVEYLDLPQEPPAIIETSRPPAYWPSSTGSSDLISVEDLVVKYAPELPPVLRGVSFTLKPRERVGLLGRTGSGKSTLAMSILRFVDPASGRIVIDGIDISKIGIHDLRSRITFIPQDATLFSGTLRENLDPFNEHEDTECLDVLYRVRMISESAYQSQRTSRMPSRASSSQSTPFDDTASSVVSTSPTDLDTKTKISLDTQVSAGGTNFSQGQRQLIAMARALLRRSLIIVLDEATSSIDFETDAKIQATIREEFTDSLLLTVAHRLRTVIDYDRLVVLEQGEIAEFDTPLNLIRKENGIFKTMCLKSGTFAELEAAAKAKVERDQNAGQA
ncbi:multidrug resistance-associated ABC transporter [Coniophora puteana RWD-64-598 SS2]|uniref:Multidrug resistance-associated ABC transporter n=1 Tax=Coniophora puteana (strain RWD-64-598) TaxID=741705 RepID=A0A5M3MUB0_CONPW|nr:multidrug resistance-associated ABC transporter [Coniophora puteana RWD-64-598 SS2]EIW82703.1 multidrug resistance-associated ABC transporter [Coniophora puteana RWD-64-598 SS2]